MYKILNSIKNNLILIIIISIIFFKLIFYFLVKNEFIFFDFGGGSDADYYHDYAMGNIDLAVNIWPEFLRFLNALSLYNREWISYFFLFLNLIVIPLLVAKLSNLNFKTNQKNYLYCFLICLIYPTIFIFTFDIYRDVLMVFIFLIGCLFFKKMFKANNFMEFFYYYILLFMIGLLLFLLRPYLGYAFLSSLFLWKINLTKIRIFSFSVLYIIALFILNYFGFFENLTEYRSGFEEIQGGSTLGLNFSNPAMFIPNFILSLLGQLLGLYITNPFAIILLFIEVFPFFGMLLYIIKNIKYADGFVRFLIIFFVLYASVWLIGNDNLGTAVRLRMYNYLAIYICFFYILRVKNSSSILSQDTKK